LETGGELLEGPGGYEAEALVPVDSQRHQVNNWQKFVDNFGKDKDRYVGFLRLVVHAVRGSVVWFLE